MILLPANVEIKVTNLYQFCEAFQTYHAIAFIENGEVNRSNCFVAWGLFLFLILLSLYRAKGIKQFWTPGFLGRFLHKDRFIGVTTMEASSAGTSATTFTCRHEGVLITFEGLQLFFITQGISPKWVLSSLKFDSLFLGLSLL